MVRRVGFNDAGNTERQDIRAGESESRDIAAKPPEVQRDWTRIVFQSLWVDLWAIAAFKASESIFDSLIDDSETVSIDNLAFLSIALLGGLISVRKLIRLLRGQPVVAGGFLKQSR
jgi:hypothetical protein